MPNSMFLGLGTYLGNKKRGDLSKKGRSSISSWNGQVKELGGISEPGFRDGHGQEDDAGSISKQLSINIR